METLGIVLAVLVLLAVSAVVVAGLVIRHKLRSLGKALNDAFGEELPTEISLINCGMPVSDKELMRRVEGLEREGFTRAGCFEVQPMDGVRVVGLVHEQDDLAAAVYRHPQAGVWADLVAVYVTAGSLTVSNAPHGAELDHRPAHHKIYEPVMDEQDLMDLMRRKVGTRERRPVSPGSFREHFEADYAAEMRWRMDKGGATLQEIERVVANTNSEFSSKEIARAKAVLAARVTPDLDSKVREAFAAQMTGAEWEWALRRGVIIRADLTLGELEDPIYNALEDADLLGRYEEPLEACWEDSLDGEASLSTIVMRVNAVLPQDHRFYKVAEITEPIEAQLYVLD